jgi:hypothetical protein
MLPRLHVPLLLVVVVFAFILIDATALVEGVSVVMLVMFMQQLGQGACLQCRGRTSVILLAQLIV